MRTVTIICTECSIRVYYDDCSIKVSRSLINLIFLMQDSNMSVVHIFLQLNSTE